MATLAKIGFPKLKLITTLKNRSTHAFTKKLHFMAFKHDNIGNAVKDC